MNSNTNQIYKEKEKFYRDKFNESTTLLRNSSFLRVAIFITYIFIAVYAANESNGTLLSLTTVIFIFLFGIAVRYSNKIKYQTNHFLFLAQINKEETMRLNGRLTAFDQGSDFLTEEHPYAVDLDVFGNNSLFQLINRSSTFWGRNLLANWLKNLASRETIISRQFSVEELSGDVDWLQNFQATGRHYHNKKDVIVFLQWLKSKNLLLGNKILNLSRFIFPLISTGLLFGVVFMDLHFTYFLLSLLVNSLILGSVLSKVNSIHKNTNEGIVSLQAVESLIIEIEKREFQDPGLLLIRKTFKNNNEQASKKIGSLKIILQQLDNRSNIFYHILNIGLLLDIHFSFAAEKWKSSNPGNTEAWFENLAQIEALTSLAGFAHTNPKYAFPEIIENPYTIEAISLGHPLIPAENRICNDFKIVNKGSIAMITGSNMAGKSTFLRTLGLNQILALTGSKVCAESMTVGPVQVYTSMRTQDNLGENISSFYAELQRIQQLIQYTQKEKPILFLLDEILKGTNSKDRHLGAVSLVNQLSKKTAFGLISTHDISLAKETMKSNQVTNYSFNSTIEGDEIFFDFKLTPGICESFNASKLMQKIGIELINSKTK